MGFFEKLVAGLGKTRDNIVAGFDSIFSGFSSIDEDFYEELEEILIMSDMGIDTTMNIIEDLKKKVKEKFPDKNIWCYTGFDFEKDVVGKMVKVSKTSNELVRYLDVVVDGKFEEDKKDLKLRFRGSSNQRIIDVKESLKENKVVEFKLK